MMHIETYASLPYPIHIYNTVDPEAHSFFYLGLSLPGIPIQPTTGVPVQVDHISESGMIEPRAMTPPPILPRRRRRRRRY